MYRVILITLLLIGCGCPQEYGTPAYRGSGCYNAGCNNQPTYRAGPFSCSPRSSNYVRTEFRCWDRYQRDFDMVLCDRSRARPGCFLEPDYSTMRCDATHICRDWF